MVREGASREGKLWAGDEKGGGDIEYTHEIGGLVWQHGCNFSR